MARSNARFTDATVEVQGLDALIRDLRAMPQDLKQELQRAVNEAGTEILVPHIRNNVVPQRGLIGKPTRPDGSRRKGYRPGGLQRGVRARVKAQSLQGIIENRAKRKGYPYPAVYEYGNGERRAFLSTGLQDKAGPVVRRLDEALSEVVQRHGWKGAA